MEWVRITDEVTFKQRVLFEVDWPHSFIREISVVSPSYILPDSRMVAPDCLPSVRVFISSQSEIVAGLELLFVEVDEFAAWFTGDLSPNVNMFNEVVKWKFNESANASVTSKFLYFRFLGSDSWGKNLRYGWEDVFSDGGELSIL
ncbi:hypothetical protein NBRC116583_38370 [Arenicella sp. 4NH20-0111]|uniref:hypothetical protein n=1 Tax=Arenicella sp. 4NH20-0111 TaxID=3127648 RepID=UPI00310C0389